MIDLVRPVCRPPDDMVEKARESIDQLMGIENRFKDDLHGKVFDYLLIHLSDVSTVDYFVRSENALLLY